MKPAVIIFQSHPIQYFSPLYKRMGKEGVALKVNYYADHGLNAELDKEFNTKVSWDVPLLEGYDHEFLPNHARTPSIYSFFGCMNWSVFDKVKEAGKDTLVVVYGWKYLSDILVMLACLFYGKKLCLRTETPWSQEQLNQTIKARLKRWVFRRILFPKVHYFFYIGSENKRFYQALGANDEKLIFSPYAVDNERFRKEYDRISEAKETLRKERLLPIDKHVFLYSGKLIPKKRPLDLLQALHLMQNDKVFVVFMGDGALKEPMQRYITENGLQTQVLITGFINQTEISKYYTAADTFVMCSEQGETWGLSTNEAMNFRLPVILSTLTGSSADLVMSDHANGYRFETGDVQELAEKMKSIMLKTNTELVQMGEQSGLKILDYSYDTIIKNLKSLLVR